MGYSNSDLKGDFLGTSKQAKLAKEYGVAGVQFGRNDGRQATRLPDQVGKEVAAKMSNDYDVRRSLEAASLSGNKKAQNIGAINDIDSAMAADKFMRKTHTNRMGNGGAYDGTNDKTGVTNFWVNRDRSKLMDSMSADQQQTEEAITPDPKTTYETSPETVKAKETVKAWQESDLGGGVYGASSGGSSASSNKAESKPITTNVDDFVANYKNDVYKGAKMQPNISI